MLKMKSAPQRGAAMLEVLVSFFIVTFGLIALAGLQTRMNMAQMESYQRAQAIVLLKDMSQRILANMNNAGSYVTGTTGTAPLGTDTTTVTTAETGCASLTTRAAIDLCEWSYMLKGAGEKNTSTTASVGAMIGARGCVEQVQAADPSTNVCTPAIYRVSVAWQGLNTTVSPGVNCGSGSYGSDDSLRKVVASQVVIPLPSCS